MSKDYKTIKIKKKRQTAWITLNRPDRLNAINHVMLQELHIILDKLENDQKIRCIIITSEGNRAFSSGADLKDLQSLTPETAREFSISGQKVFSKIEKISKPVIAAIKGYTLGGGLELALACDFRIASDNAEFGCPEIKLGFIPAWGGTVRLPLIIGLSNAKRLIMIGETIQSNESYRIGLLDKIVPFNNLKTEVEDFTQKLSEFSSEALKQSKRLINFAINSSYESNFKKETELFVFLIASKNTKENIHAFLNFRERKNMELSKSK